MRIFAIILLFAPTISWAFELIMIQAVSQTQKSFVTRRGMRQGVMPGYQATFTADNFSLLARAREVTGEFTQWEVVNRDARIPFRKGQVVTFYPATEYIWALAPEKVRRKYIKSSIKESKQSFVAKGAFSRGLSESVSDAPATVSRRGGALFELLYERDFFYSLSWDLGLRYEREVLNIPAATFITKRALIVGDITYYFDQLEEYISGRIYFGLGLGYGLSNTQTTGLSQSGLVGLLPSVKLGFNLPITNQYEFLIDSAFDSLQTQEEQAGGRVQTTTQTNFRVGIGLRRYF